MAHNIFGNRIAFVEHAPWHGLGTEAPRGVRSDEMIVKAGLQWPVWKQPAPGAWFDEGTGAYDRYLVMRPALDEELEPTMLGFVGQSYEPLQNVAAFRFFDPFLDRGWATLETAGALGKGERVWVLARLEGQMHVGGRDDTVDRFLLLSNSHDGSSGVTVRFTAVRVVCQNTLNLALTRGKQVVSVWHTANLHRNLRREQAEKLKVVADRVFAEGQHLFDRMAECPMRESDTAWYLERMFPRTERQTTRRLEPLRWTRVRAILKDETVTPLPTRHTLWGLYNAVVRDEDYRSTTEATPSTRLSRVWFGRGSDLKLKALGLARRMVETGSLN
ncbi:MAG: DUF932 domain-containing protein [Gemmatimonadetes bacterium]|nr:DUF932 domain-containing protein [Gemmatimonadota bacterium]